MFVKPAEPLVRIRKENFKLKLKQFLLVASDDTSIVFLWIIYLINSFLLLKVKIHF